MSRLPGPLVDPRRASPARSAEPVGSRSLPGSSAESRHGAR
jgi:hypothetical protein